MLNSNIFSKSEKIKYMSYDWFSSVLLVEFIRQRVYVKILFMSNIIRFSNVYYLVIKLFNRGGKNSFPLWKKRPGGLSSDDKNLYIFDMLMCWFFLIWWRLPSLGLKQNIARWFTRVGEGSLLKTINNFLKISIK